LIKLQLNIFAVEQPFNSQSHLLYSIKKQKQFLKMKQLTIFTIVVSAILLSSCNKNNDQATGVGDVLIVSKQSGANTVYGISLFAYTFSTFQSVKATNIADASKTYTLKANQGYKSNFYYEATGNDFTTTKPAATTYNFSAVFENGATQEFQDILTDKVLPIPSFVKCEYDPIGHQLVTNWALLTDANSYAINIFDGSTLVFGSTELSSSVDTYSISAVGGGWATGFTPANGKTYTVRLYAYLYEPSGGSYDIQAISYVEKSVVWGN
jgi:predicted small secreted protein